MKKLSILLFPAFILIFALITTSVTNANNAAGQVNTQKPQTLPVVGSYEKLKTLLAEANKSAAKRSRQSIFMEDATSNMKAANVAKSDEMSASGAAAPDYSGTNVQVRGVDEADVVKTDGKFIYQVNEQKVTIIRAYPADEMEIVKTIEFADKNFTPQELYVDNKHLVVIGSTNYNMPIPQPEQAPVEKRAQQAMPYPPFLVQNTVKTVIFDTTDKTNITKIRETELDGTYISSRKIGSSLYLAANKYIDYYTIENAQPTTPAFRDSAGSGKFTDIRCEDIKYFPGSPEPNYLMIASLDLEKPGEQIEVSTYLGAGQNLYASVQNLYVVVTQFDTPVRESTIKQKAARLIRPQYQSNTAIYKFGLDKGKSSYLGKGEVSGTILNQFSMDEYNGYFRIATTIGEVSRGDNTSKNNVYILDENLKITGKIEDIAPGERIYSVRFMGGRAYMVTFKKVDPLFVIDLSLPKAPKILGQLKIPGYSDYLHPYDENHIIGFGKDAAEIPGQNWGYYQGMKIAVFDVSDVAHPVEKFKELIGDRGTDSELLHNHKALLFSKAKNLLAFPVRVMEIREKTPGEYGIQQYGQFSFQGAYVYNFDLMNGFKLKRRITHQDTVYITDFDRYSDMKNDVERIMYIEDTLYTTSKGMIKAHDLANFKETKSLNLQ